MKTPAAICPVPLEQQPLNEYQSLSTSWFYRWGTWTGLAYLKPIAGLWLSSWLFAAPIAAVSFPPAKDPLHFGLSAAIGALVLPTLTLLQLYLGWRYVQNRLVLARIPYEESGWYDGQTWDKPAEVVARDRLIGQYQIAPIIHRLHRTFMGIGLAVLITCLVWQFPS